MSFPAEALTRLAEKVFQGDVVFFVGAGFSLDSERNTAGRLIKRLLARLNGFAKTLQPAGQELLNELCITFHLNLQTTVFQFSESDVQKLSDRYYETNEWFCTAFTRLLTDAVKKHWNEQDVLRLNETEKPILAIALDPVPLEPITPGIIALARSGNPSLRRAAGKALFLDTMGFADPLIMGGEPSALALSRVSDTYQRKLLPRHYVIARLAREGLCGTTLTTNFDMLLDGAFRLAGFQPTGLADGSGDQGFPPTTFPKFARPSSPAQFFTEGKEHRTAVLVKMHGDVEKYRETRNQLQKPGPIQAQVETKNPAASSASKPEEWKINEENALSRYLPSMIFTYREIQNWRTDSWAADYIRTLLRTRVVVLCGYSVQDPVIHDTFRTVYEEMARLRQDSPSRNQIPPTQNEPKNAPAFFFARDGNTNREFYGQEVLRAATSAVGAGESPLPIHPNTIPFFRKDESGQGDFPDLDETLQWLFHLTFRQLQHDSLISDLRRITTLLLKRPAPERELAKVRQDFENVVSHEQARAKAPGPMEANGTRLTGAQPLNRSALREICAWTESFHPGLLREFAAADSLSRRQGPGPALDTLRAHPWDDPARQDSGWTAWGAVVEIALRRLAAAPSTQVENQLAPVENLCDPCLLKATGSHHPTLLFHARHAPSPELAAPQALTILFGGFLATLRAPASAGQPVTHTIWMLQPGDAPWPPDKDASQPDVHWPSARCRWVRAPHAEWVWRWAVGTGPNTKWSPLALHSYGQV